MRSLNSFAGLIRYRYKLYYSEIKGLLNNGSFIYSVNPSVRFVCNRKDFFSKILFISNGHEKLEMSWCNKWLSSIKDNSWVIDCGANIGFYSSYLAQTNPQCQILAIEGNKNTHAILKHNLEKLGLENVSLVQGILADKEDNYFQILDNPGREPWQQAKSTSSSDVKTYTLDGLVSEYGRMPDLVKIDCEGFEVKILKGALGLLSKSSTVFMVECNDTALKEAGTGRVELFDLFRKNNFKLFHLASFGGESFPLGKVITDEFPSSEFNFVAIPDKQEVIKTWEKILMEN